MAHFTDVQRARLEDYLESIGAVLGNARRRASFATYAVGLLAEGDRKSVEPIAARACADPAMTDAVHQRLLHFLCDSKWSDSAVRLTAARYALKHVASDAEPVEAWILDDTGFLKQGEHSAGVQRQYTGSAGKVTNCQVGVSLSLATRTDHFPVDFELYLPVSWTSDKGRRRDAHIPESVDFKTKPQLALDMLSRALEGGLPRGIVLADAGYGASSEFRLEIQRLGLQYSVGANPMTKVFEVFDVVNRGGRSISLQKLARKLDAKGKFKTHAWRDGTRKELSARFAVRRVTPTAEQDRPLAERQPVWLIIEWRHGETEPANYFLCSLPKETPQEELIRLTMQRWRTERAYEDLKGELGLDHYEGRSFPGWHHHISVVLSCYAFAVAERHRFFPLTTKRSCSARSHNRAP